MNEVEHLANALAQVVWWNQFNQQNYNQIYQLTVLEVTPNFNALRSMPYSNKISVNLLEQKLLICRYKGQFH